MKKLITIALALILMLAMTACGGGSSDGNGGEEGEGTTPVEKKSATSELKGDLSLGSVESNVYTNESLGIKISVPEDAGYENNLPNAQSIILDSESIDVPDDVFSDDAVFAKTVKETGLNLPLADFEKLECKIKLNIAPSLIGPKDMATNTLNALKESYDVTEVEKVEMGGLYWQRCYYTTEVMAQEMISASLYHQYGDYLATIEIITFGDGPTLDEAMKMVQAL